MHLPHKQGDMSSILIAATIDSFISNHLNSIFILTIIAYYLLKNSLCPNIWSLHTGLSDFWFRVGSTPTASTNMGAESKKTAFLTYTEKFGAECEVVEQSGFQSDD